MLEGPGGFLLQLADQRIGHVAHLHQAGIGHQVEDALEQIDHRIARHRQHRPDEEAEQGPPHVAGHQVRRAEAQVHQRQHGKGNQGRHELPPAAVEIAERAHRDHAGHEEHHEQHDPVVRENQQRKQGHHIDGHHDPVAHERLQQQGRQGEGHEIQPLLVYAHQDQRDGREQHEHDHQVRETRVRKQLPVGEIDRQEQHGHDGQRNQDVAEQH